MVGGVSYFVEKGIVSILSEETVLRPASQVGTRPQGWGTLVNAALLSLINEACVAKLRYPPLE